MTKNKIERENVVRSCWREEPIAIASDKASFGEGILNVVMFT